MDAGGMDRRVRLLRAGPPVDDGYTTKPGQLAALADVWARVRPAPGTERFASGQTAASAPTVFQIRYSTTVADLNPKDRLEYPIGSGRIHDIKSVTEIGRREGLEIVAIGATD